MWTWTRERSSTALAGTHRPGWYRGGKGKGKGAAGKGEGDDEGKGKGKGSSGGKGKGGRGGAQPYSVTLLRSLRALAMFTTRGGAIPFPELCRTRCFYGEVILQAGPPTLQSPRSPCSHRRGYS